MPDHRQVMMTPIVVEVNGDGIPDVVFNSFVGSNYTTNGVLRAISGADGTELWTVTDPALRIRGAASVAAADIDGDGLVEICTVPESGSGILCFENTGALKFRTAVPANDWGGVSFADLDGDGLVEILDGNHVFSNSGVLKWVGIDGMGGIAGTGPISFAADIDGDGLQEVINGRAIYRHDGTLKCRNTSIGHGLAGVANFDNDSHGEIVVVSSGRVALMDDDCALLWSTAIPGAGAGGAPNIADFDADGRPEIGVAGASRYVVLETDGAIKWSSPTQDASSSRTGSSTFDFEGDGRAEVVYADEQRLRIYDGATGAVRFDVQNTSGTTYENPLIVDVDGDDNAEIVVASNNYAFSGPTGIRVYRDRKDGWVNTRRIWNQHAYSVTNIHDDGSVPAHPIDNWRIPGLNTFRANSQGNGATNPFAASDVTVTEVTSSCDRSTGALSLNARVLNQGDAAASAGLRVAFYQGDPTAGGTLLGVATLSSVLSASASAVATLALASAPGGTSRIWAIADEDGTGTGRETECVESNNGNSAPVNLACSTNEPPVALCRDVIVIANAETCRASASVDDGSHDPDHQPAPFTVTQSPSGPFGQGTHTVTLTVSDGASSDVCTATVTVIDTTAPVIVCPAERIVDATDPEGAFVTPTQAIATDACGATVSGPSAGIYPLGSTVLTYSATDAAGHSASCTTELHVVKRNAPPPDFTMCQMPRYTSAAMIKACGWATAGESGESIHAVLLTVDGGPPLRLEPEPSGGFVITWMDLAEGHHVIALTAIGAQGSVATREMEVTVDRTAPVFRVLSPALDEAQPAQVDIVSEVTDLTPVKFTANWINTLDLPAGTNIATHALNFSTAGYNPVLLRATDAAGNTSEQFIQVLVQ
ncbi:FG-GAP-like repeat-containing protein [Corallococcus sp. bb12-1]|uniref:FG-GAP-like repeat-containing protein n=1 Tax=Corallococcus sp. bb12-1 TaxID=2996784 RepID=UPI00226F3DCD|nr:FG-GAP-like repeat-containing protein [Corallococcus sp. bb12-1]MCY1043249.1 FG-GAP-like repeat-containing protein [Corallococcus sp. bb12-1]